MPEKTEPTTEQLARLKAPFPPEEVGKLPRVTCTDCSDKRKQCTEHDKQRCGTCNAWVSTKHIHLDYVGHADVTFRLLEVDPTWSWEPVATDEHGLPVLDTDQQDNPVGMWIRLTVLGVTRLGYGSCPPGQNDAVKVLIGDALRNAAMRFGVALDLWAKGDRADPSAENAVDAPGSPSRRRAPAKAKTTNPQWMNEAREAIANATTTAALERAGAEIKRAVDAGEVADSDRDHLAGLYKAAGQDIAAASQPEAPSAEQSDGGEAA